jgi:TM2 domain-containing membrane protein YozV
MRGQILGYDYRTGLGEISGDDGKRYKFLGTEWRQQSQPRAGQPVDFEARADEALAVYGIAPASPFAGGAGTPNKLVAALLALFLGTIGIHKFYLGYNKAGLIMLLVAVFGAILLFVPTMIIAVIAFVEAITYLMTPDEEWYQRYVVGERPWF